MNEETIETIGDYISAMRRHKSDYQPGNVLQDVIFRGQSDDYPLLPKICRLRAKEDFLQAEKQKIYLMAPSDILVAYRLLTVLEEFLLRSYLMSDAPGFHSILINPGLGPFSGTAGHFGIRGNQFSNVCVFPKKYKRQCNQEENQKVWHSCRVVEKWEL